MGSPVIRWNDGKSKYCCFATPDLGLLAFEMADADVTYSRPGGH